MRVAFPSFVLAILLTTSAAQAATHDSKLDDTSLAGRNEYERCLSLIKRNAREAADSAEMWHTLGGGVPALHCEALALVSLRRYADAGVKLDQAALSESPSQKNFRIALFDQAGNAWLLAGDAQKAEASINAALALAPKDEDILFDRARARAARKNWSGAETDLSALLAMDANRADALVLRASARHAQGQKPQADADIARALQVYPNYPEALVERGAMKYEAGDAAGARADWQLAARDAPNGDAGAAARQHLADMDAAAAKPAGK